MLVSPVTFCKTCLDHLHIDVLTVQQEHLTESPSVPVSSIGFHIDGLVQYQGSKVLCRLLGEGLSIPVFAGRGLRGINTYQSDGELHIPVLHDEGVTIYDPINLVLTCSGKGWEKEGKD